MRCINWPATSIAFALSTIASIGSAGAQSPAPAPHRPTIIDDALTGKAMLGRFDYVGHWQHVRDKFDGRTDGTSTRSTKTGDVAILNFTGTRVRIFGVTGPSGGRAGISLDQESTGGRPVDFYAKRMNSHALIYQSPMLHAGVHTVTLVVWGTRNESGRFYYVNIDGAEIDP